MQFYRAFDSTLNIEDARVHWESTQADAHAAAKTFSSASRRDVRIELCDVPNDRPAMLALLRGDMPDVKVLRTWRLTDRGGLHDCENGE